MVGYGVAVRKHLIPGLGAHKLDKLRPEHIEHLYGRMMAAGSKPGTAHQVHRTFRTALNEAVRRGHLGQNPVRLAKAPRVREEEIEPFTVEEVQRLLRAADDRRNSARWAVALALGLGLSVGSRLLADGQRRAASGAVRLFSVPERPTETGTETERSEGADPNGSAPSSICGSGGI